MCVVSVRRGLKLERRWAGPGYRCCYCSAFSGPELPFACESVTAPAIRRLSNDARRGR
jgi:hypothetical protein